MKKTILFLLTLFAVNISNAQTVSYEDIQTIKNGNKEKNYPIRFMQMIVTLKYL